MKTKSEGLAFAVGGTGLFLGLITLNVAWPFTLQLNHWHHGLLMLAASFAATGYGVGAWSGERRAEKAEAEAAAAYDHAKESQTKYLAILEAIGNERRRA